MRIRKNLSTSNSDTGCLLDKSKPLCVHVLCKTKDDFKIIAVNCYLDHRSAPYPSILGGSSHIPIEIAGTPNCGAVAKGPATQTCTCGTWNEFCRSSNSRISQRLISDPGSITSGRGTVSTLGHRQSTRVFHSSDETWSPELQ